MHRNPKERKKTKPGAEVEEDAEIAVAAEVVEEEGVEGFRDKTPHGQLSVSCMALVFSYLLLIRCTNAVTISEVRTSCHHHQKTPCGTKAQ